MSKKTTYYRKPQQVEAIRWVGEQDFLDALQKAYHVVEYTFDAVTPDFGTLAEYRAGDLEVKHVARPGRVNGVDTFYVAHGDWLVVEDGEGTIYNDEEFRREFFFIVKEVKTHAPSIEEILCLETN